MQQKRPKTITLKKGCDKEYIDEQLSSPQMRDAMPGHIRDNTSKMTLWARAV